MRTNLAILFTILFLGFINFSNATVYTVTLATDGNAFGGGNAGDMRWCLLQASAAAASGPHSVVFAIPGVAPFNIVLAAPFAAIPNITGGITINGFSQAGWASNPIIHLDGPGYGDGLIINNSNNSLIQGLIFSDFNTTGITIQNSLNTIVRGCWVGVNATPAAVGAGGGAGILLVNGDNCSIGGDLSINPEYKILIVGRDNGIRFNTGSSYNTVYGAFLGVNLAGTATLGTQIANAAIYITNSNENIIGGTGNGRRNVLSYSNYGVMFETSPCRRNKVYNNLIGTDINGALDLGNNTNGIRFKDGCHNNEIGSKTVGEGNIISGNNQEGIFLEGNVDSTLIGRNYLGLGSNGTTIIVNGTAANHHAIIVQSNTAERSKIFYNVIVTPNRGSGIYYDGGGYDTIAYNYVGTDATGLAMVGIGSSTTEAGILVNTGNPSPDMVFIGNVVAGSKGNGIDVRGGSKNNIVFKGNIIGMDRNGNGTTFGNVWTGIYLHPGASTNLIIGGTNTADRNIISMNGRSAVTIGGCPTVNGLGIVVENYNGINILGNYIGVDATGLLARGNGNSGIMINQTGCSNAVIGGTAAGSRNIICSNGFNCTDSPWPNNARHGVQFVTNSGPSRVEGNYVGLGVDGTTLLGNSEEGVSTYDANNVTVGGNTAAHRNIIGGNAKGVYFQNSGAGITNCKVQGNYIGTDVTGTIAKPNVIGVHLNRVYGNLIGGPNPGEGNIIRNHTQNGVLLDNADNTIIQQNIIQTNVGDGVRFQNGTTGVLIGSATITALGNDISNNFNGVNVTEAASFQDQIRRNSIYCNTNKGINLNGVGNTNILINVLTSTAPYITAPAPGITGTFTNQTTSALVGTDVIEVFWDNACGTCQGRTYLGDATSLNSPAAGDWSYSPLPAASDCIPKGAAGCLVGVTNITATRTNIAGNTSEFMGCDPVFLPVDLISFAAKRNGTSSALLSWVTASEKNNAYFEILRSSDGKTYIPVGIVQGAGNSSLQINYSFTDDGLSGGTYYYILNQVDFDGKNSFSEIRVVNFGNDAKVDVVPTVVSNGEPVRVLNFTGGELVNISVIDMTGKVYASYNNVSGPVTDIETTGLAAGVYLVKIVAGDEVVTKKVLVY